MTQSRTKRHPRVRSLLYWGGAFVVVVAFLAGLTMLGGGDEPERPPAGVMESGERDVTLDLETDVVDDQLRIFGRTDVSDGAILSYEVHQVDDPRLDYRAAGHVQVEYGSFEERIDISGWPAGDVEVYVAFPPTYGEVTQPSHVIDRYGKRGERLRGANVREFAHGRVLEQISVIHWRGMDETGAGEDPL